MKTVTLRLQVVSLQFEYQPLALALALALGTKERVALVYATKSSLVWKGHITSCTRVDALHPSPVLVEVLLIV